MRHFYAATAFLVAGSISVFFDYGCMAPYLVAQTCVLGTTISIFLGVLNMNKPPKKDGNKP